MSEYYESLGSNEKATYRYIAKLEPVGMILLLGTSPGSAHLRNCLEHMRSVSKMLSVKSTLEIAA